MPNPRIYPPRAAAPLPNARDLSVDSEEESFNVYASLEPLEESDDDIKSIILEQLRKYKHVSVRIRKNHGSSSPHERVAVLTFDSLDALNYFKRAILEKRHRIIVYDKVLFFNFGRNRHSFPMGNRITDRLNESRARHRHNWSPRANGDRSRSTQRYPRREPTRDLRRPPIAISRTLFVGNLDDDTESGELRRIFEPYGTLLEVIMKHPASPQSSPYAFIKFKKLLASVTAREQLQDTYIGRRRVKIGFGKVSPTHALWIGGLNDATAEEELVTEVRRHSRPVAYEFHKEENYAYFVFESIEDCKRAYSELEEVKLVHSGAKLEVDYADTHTEVSRLMDNARVREKRRRSDSSSSRTSGEYNERKSEHRSRSPLFEKKRVKVNRSHREGDSYSSSTYSSPAARSASHASHRSNSKDASLQKGGLHGNLGDGIKIDEINSRTSSVSPTNKKTRTHVRVQEKIDEDKDKQVSGSQSNLGNTGNPASSSFSAHKQANSYGVNVSLGPGGESSNQSFSQILVAYPIVWRGAISVKTNIFYLHLHLICGSVDAVSTMVHQAMLIGSDPTLLQLTKRFPLLPDRIMDLRAKLATAIASRDCCILIAQTPTSDSKDNNLLPPSGGGGGGGGLTSKPMSNLVTYFQQKQAAGIGNVGPTTIYAFPPSPFTQEQLATLMPHAVHALTCGNDNYLMVVISR